MANDPPEVCTFGQDILAQTLGVAELPPCALWIGRRILHGESPLRGVELQGNDLYSKSCSLEVLRPMLIEAAY